MKVTGQVAVWITSCLVVAAGSIKYGYQKALVDVGVGSTFELMGHASVYHQILVEKGPDEAERFLVKEIDFGVSTHRFAFENQSWLSKYIGPESYISKNGEHYIGYYERVQKLVETQPLLNESSKEDLKWLIENAK